ncbi:hypothetical protein A5819_003520 [Enterococcus sp. 7E2_DIV0204]|uniref:hypothetical protein n=1 Tax=unclassified Enterococcus TaxID=2608891 RepID=UPI000A32D1F3|nr:MULTISPECIES: hypothetical protein [unclassified Enterococcus]OTN83970.1 hypothetical protein A5819_003520 [Enterococcus sp. 7E2_DIV0204]OTP46878.1 hypothetical protein A5884_003756 [Enterococcus sp. 7D2_DIV0200]
MNHKKKISKKIIAGVSLCAIALSGIVGYGVYHNLTPEKVETKGTPLNPTERGHQLPVIPDAEKSTKKGNAVTDAVKKATQDSSLEDFKSIPYTNNQQEKTQALTQLNNLVRQEQQSQKKQQENNKQGELTQLVNKPAEVKPSVPSDGGNKPVTPKPEPEKPIKPVDPIDPPVVEIDYSALQTLVQQAQEINLSLYLSSSIEQFKLELVVSQRMLEDSSSSQEAVNNQVYRLQQAINQLVLKGDKTALQTLLMDSQGMKTDIYTDETVASFEEAKSQAQSVLDNAEAPQIQVDQVKQYLQQAIDNLKEKEEPYLSLAYLQRIVDQAQKINASEYTPSTAEVLTVKLTEVTEYLSKNEYTKELNEKYGEELQQAIDQLQKKGDTSKIKELLTTISAIDRTKYTEESLAHLDTVCSDIQVQLSNEELTQKEADTLYQNLSEAFSQLEELVATDQEK